MQRKEKKNLIHPMKSLFQLMNNTKECIGSLRKLKRKQQNSLFNSNSNKTNKKIVHLKRKVQVQVSSMGPQIVGKINSIN